MDDNKQPSDEHDFSDFDDLFAEPDEELDLIADAPLASDAPSESDASSSDAIIDDDDVADLLDEPATDSDATPAAEANPDDLLDDEWDDVVADEPPVAADPPSADEDAPPDAPPAADDEEPSADDDEAPAAPPEEQPEAEQESERVMGDDEVPDIDFHDDAEEEPREEVDELIEELESFDDFIIDDDEPAIASDFSDETALEPEPQAEAAAAAPTPEDDAPAPRQDDDWEEEREPAGQEEERILPEPEEELVPPEPDNSEEEEASMKQSNMIALIAGAVALIASMGGLWLGYSAKAELAQMPAQSGGNAVLNDAKLKGIDKKLAQADERITKLATKLASVTATTGGTPDPRVDALDARTARLEQLISDVKEEIGHLRTMVAAQQARPAPVRRPVQHRARPKPKAKPKPVAAAHRGGAWFVNLTSHSSPASARRQVRQMQRLGITAESKQVLVKGHTYYRVRIAGFASKAKANAFRAMLAKKYKITDSWVSNY